MTLIDRVRAFMAPIQQKASALAPLFARYGLVYPRWTPDNLEAYSREGYGKNPVVYRCVDILGRSVATTPWQLMSGSGDTAKEVEDAKHPLLMLLQRPNPMQGGSSFFKTAVAYYLLHGNAYFEGVSTNEETDGLKVPRELYIMRSDRVKIVPHPVIANMPGAFVYDYNGGRKTFLMNPITGTGPVMQWKTFNPTDDWYGQGTIKAAAAAVDQHNDASSWNASLLQNGAAPSGGFKFAPAQGIGDSLTLEQRKQLQKDIEERISGPSNARRPLILDGGLEWMEIGMSPKEMDWLEGKKGNAIDICAVFGVPGQVYGIPDAQTFANYAEARLAMYEEMVIPLLDSLCDELNHWLVPAFGDDLTLRPNWDKVDALAPKRTQQWERVAKADWLTLNEKREATNYDRLEEPMADQVFVEAGKVPLGMSDPESGAAAPGDNGTPELDADGNPIPGQPADPNAPLPPVDGSGNGAPSDQVQQAGLNGTQLTGLQGILDGVANGETSPEAAVILILLAFPTFDPEKVQEMVDAQDAFEPTPPPAPVGPDGQPLAPGTGPDGLPAKPGAGQPPGAGKKPAKKPPKLPAKSNAETLVAELIAEGFKEDAALALTKLAYGEG
jgi:HK97 family phage portal protein